MESITKQLMSNKVPVILAVVIALAVGGWYIMSGRSNLDSNTRQLSTEEEIQEINSSNPERIKIKCKNGTSYNIVFSPNQSNYDDLIFNACGEEGGVQE